MIRLKKILFCGVLFFQFLSFTFSNSISYKTKRDTKYSDGGPKYTFPINANEKLLWKQGNSYGITYDSFADTIDFSISLYDKNEKLIWLKGTDLVLENSSQMFLSSNYQFIPVYYLDMLKNRDKTIRQSQPEVIKYEKSFVPDFGGRDDEFFLPEHIIISNLFVYFTPNNFYLIEKIEFENDIYKLYLNKDDKDIWGNKVSFSYEQPYSDTYLKHKDDSNIVFLLKFDGDYLDIWINSLQEYMGKYYVAPRDTQEEIGRAVVKGIFNLSNVYWPRHADGTSDFDKEIKEPLVKLATKVEAKSSDKSKINKTTLVTQTSKATPSTNVAQNKTMLVKENLKLRSGEATSTQVLTVMQAGTKVKILELGKSETIDGINSNWVKVEVQKGAKDRDGNPIKAGTVGWCYGGYLE